MATMHLSFPLIFMTTLCFQSLSHASHHHPLHTSRNRLQATLKQSSAGRQPTVELWCVAKNNAEDSALQTAIDWACGPGGANCGPIQQGGPCYDPADLQKTASYAFNDYFLKHGLTEDSCNFHNTAALTSLNPSHKNCKFPSSVTASNGNFTGSSPTMGLGPSGADMSSSDYVGGRLGWTMVTIHLLYAIKLVF